MIAFETDKLKWGLQHQKYMQRQHMPLSYFHHIPHKFLSLRHYCSIEAWPGGVRDAFSIALFLSFKPDTPDLEFISFLFFWQER